MSKRTTTDSTQTNPSNWWRTPFDAALPLARALPPGSEFVEPCAGDGALVGHLTGYGHQCLRAYDLEPRAPGIEALDATARESGKRPMVITNPPFAWKLLKPLLDVWIGTVPTWLLLPTDMLFNLRTQPYVAHVDRIIPLGRVSWLGNGQGGMENYAWFRFAVTVQPFLTPRQPKGA